MAIDFNGTDQWLDRGSPPVTTYPFMVSLWFNVDVGATSNAIWWLGDNISGSQYFVIQERGDTVGNPIEFTARAGGSRVAQTTTGFTVGQWHHALAIAASATDRAVWIDAGGKGTNTQSTDPAVANNMTIGRFNDLSPSEHFDGKVAEVALWNVAPSTSPSVPDEAVILAAGISPLLVRPGNLVSYVQGVRLVGGGQPDLFGDAWTVNGSPTTSDHPRMVYPHRGPVIAVPSAGAPVVGMDFLHAVTRPRQGMAVRRM